jgi:hypothetical protein
MGVGFLISSVPAKLDILPVIVVAMMVVVPVIPVPRPNLHNNLRISLRRRINTRKHKQHR